MGPPASALWVIEVVLVEQYDPDTVYSSSRIVGATCTRTEPWPWQALLFSGFCFWLRLPLPIPGRTRAGMVAGIRGNGSRNIETETARSSGSRNAGSTRRRSSATVLAPTNTSAQRRSTSSLIRESLRPGSPSTYRSAELGDYAAIRVEERHETYASDSGVMRRLEPGRDCAKRFRTDGRGAIRGEKRDGWHERQQQRGRGIDVDHDRSRRST